MTRLRYPIGRQHFPTLIEGGYTYVDKTAFVGKLVTDEGYYFLSRPRRFGKSLFLSTLKTYFEGRRDLFKGLAIDRMDVSWDETPVIHIDMNASDYSREDGVFIRLDEILSGYEEEWEIIPRNSEPATRFGKLIKTIYQKTKKRVSILVDEYDKPLLGLKESDPFFKIFQNQLKAFYVNLKSMDEYIRFAMITGVGRFSKVSIFSDLNNLSDISMKDRYATICGLTEDELKNTFRAGIEDLAQKTGKSYDETLTELQDYYDGYRFTAECPRMYNPFSVMLALDDRRIAPYWYETGTPTFLVKKVKEKGINLPLERELKLTESQLMTVSYELDDPVPLLFQTGYLTIDRYDPKLQRYILRFPNAEVKIGFFEQLLSLYQPQTAISGSEFNISEFTGDLLNGNPDGLMRRLQAMFAGDGYRYHSEGEYRKMLYMLFTVTGSKVEVEPHTSNGRVDIRVETTDYIYFFELKFNRPVTEAMNQHHDREYYQHFALDARKKFLVGVSFVDKKKRHGIDTWLIEEIE